MSSESRRMAMEELKARANKHLKKKKAPKVQVSVESGMKALRKAADRRRQMLEDY